MAKGDNNKDDKTKTLAIPMLLDISKTFLLSKFCVVRSKYSALTPLKSPVLDKHFCVMGNKAGEWRARHIAQSRAGSGGQWMSR